MARLLHVLIVEDNPLDAELVLEELHAAGFEPVWEVVETEADYLAQLRPGLDVILSDFKLPQFNGPRALELLNERGVEIPFILVSGTIGEETAVEAMKQGAADYILKDRMSRLGPAVHHALKQSSLLRESKLAGEALKLRETALDEVSQGVVILDENELVIYANTSFTRITGYPLGEILGRSCEILQGPETAAATVAAIQAAVKAGEAFEGEILNYRKDGPTFWNDLSLTPMNSGPGQPLRYIGVQRDVTERKRTEEVLRESEERFSAAFEYAPIGMALMWPEGHWLKVNRALCEMVGYSEAELLSLNFKDITHPDDLPASWESVRRMLAGEIRSFQLEKRYIHAQGHFVAVSLSVSLVLDGAGNPQYFIAQIQDISERKRDQQALSLALERLQLAVKAGKAGTWDLDLLTGRVDWDDQMLALYGKTAANVEPGAERWYRAMHPDDREETAAVHEAALQGDADSFETEFRILRDDDGSQRFIRAMGVILRDESGRTVRMTGINWDVTEERMREESLAAALVHEKELSEKARAGDRAKSEFLAVMSHEVRTPLNGILGFSGLLASAPNLPADCRDYVKTIASSGEALLRILDDILVFSRLEAGGLKVEKALFSCRETVQSIHTLLAPHTGEERPEFRMELAEDVPEHLWNDAGRLRQVLLNLVGNAIKFTARGSIALGIRTSRWNMKGGAPGIDFFVRDTGTGIPKGELEHIFEPFAQADSSISRRYGGTGLGLAISRNLVELMGGRLTVMSEVGAGSEFCVTLPVEIPENTPRAIPDVLVETLDETFAINHPLRILLVEDDLVNLKLLRMLMRKFGYAPLFAEDGIKAVEIYRREKPDCILMDLQMPWKDGFQATGEIREIEKSRMDGSHVFIAALTANVVAEDRQRCFDVGMDAYMNKPVQLALLAKTLKQASDEHALAPVLLALETS